MVEFHHVEKTYPSGHTALRDLDLNVPRGSAFGIIGESGAGKSTLVRLVSGLERPTRGEVRVGGRDLAALSPAELRTYRARLGMVFQHFNLLAQRTAAGNVALPLELAGVLRARREARVRDVLGLVGLADLADRFPAQLSGGQKQRVGIARALALEPELLIADEATSALDPVTSAGLLRLLRDVQVQTGLTLIVITHQMEVVRAACTHVAVLERGALVETGVAADVLNRPRHAATRALLSAHQPDVPLAPGERLVQVTFEHGLTAGILTQLATLGARVVEARPAGATTEAWLVLPEGRPEHDHVLARLSQPHAGASA